MENTLLYTFSTIAQTLAGAIALLGAFVLYRLQSLGQEIDRTIDHAMALYESTGRNHGSPKPSETLMALRAEQRYVQILGFLTTTPLPESIGPEIHPQAPMVRAVARRSRIFRAFHWALGLTVGLIITSIAALMCVSLLKDAPGISVVVLIAAGLWFVGCMVSYAVLMVRTLR
jgi:hypothetical protein